MTLKPKLTKPQLIRLVAQQTGVSVKQTGVVLDAMLRTIIESVSRGEEVMLSGFGSFERHNRKKRRGINPNTKQPVIVQATKTPHFTAGTKFKKSVKQK